MYAKEQQGSVLRILGAICLCHHMIVCYMAIQFPMFIRLYWIHLLNRVELFRLVGAEGVGNVSSGQKRPLSDIHPGFLERLTCIYTLQHYFADSKQCLAIPTLPIAPELVCR